MQKYELFSSRIIEGAAHYPDLHVSMEEVPAVLQSYQLQQVPQETE